MYRLGGCSRGPGGLLILKCPNNQMSPSPQLSEHLLVLSMQREREANVRAERAERVERERNGRKTAAVAGCRGYDDVRFGGGVCRSPEIEIDPVELFGTS